MTGFSKKYYFSELALPAIKYYDWVKRQGIPNNHNCNMPKSTWLLPEEKAEIIEYYKFNPDEGYRYITYEMIDNDIVAVSPSAVYRTLREAGVMRSKNTRASSKGTGFKQPQYPHQQWHTDISYVKIDEQFYFFIGVLDGFSRYILHWELRESMKEEDVQLVMQRAIEKYPGNKTRIISDNGKQYTAKGFKEFIGHHGLTHVRTSPYYPQSNGKMERFNATFKKATIKKTKPATVEGATWMIKQYVNFYNKERLHSAIGYVTPYDKLNMKHSIIFEEREQKIKAARENRKRINCANKTIDFQLSQNCKKFIS